MHTVSKRFMELHGGDLTVHSDGPGRGSTFSFVIPLLGVPPARHRSSSISSITHTRSPSIVVLNRQQLMLQRQERGSVVARVRSSLATVVDNLGRLFFDYPIEHSVHENTPVEESRPPGTMDGPTPTGDSGTAKQRQSRLGSLSTVPENVRNSVRRSTPFSYNAHVGEEDVVMRMDKHKSAQMSEERKVDHGDNSRRSTFLNEPKGPPERENGVFGLARKSFIRSHGWLSGGHHGGGDRESCDNSESGPRSLTSLPLSLSVTMPNSIGRMLRKSKVQDIATVPAGNLSASDIGGNGATVRQQKMPSDLCHPRSSLTSHSRSPLALHDHASHRPPPAQPDPMSLPRRGKSASPNRRVSHGVVADNKSEDRPSERNKEIPGSRLLTTALVTNSTPFSASLLTRSSSHSFHKSGRCGDLVGSSISGESEGDVSIRRNRNVSRDNVVSSLSSPPRILVVDDSAINRKMICRLLSLRCVQVSQAGDGLEAISCYKRGQAGGVQYDVILMDHLMPNMDGPTAARELRSLGYDNIIVGLTGVTDESLLAVFWSSGVNHILKKPLDAEELWKLISVQDNSESG